MELEYPIGFPTDCQNVVETERLRADKDFSLTEPTQTLEQRAHRWVCRILGAFARQACELGKTQRWTLAQVRSAVDQFCLNLVRKASYLLSDGRLGWVQGVLGTTVRADVRRAIENSEEWRRHCDELLQIAEVQNQLANPMATNAAFQASESSQEPMSGRMALPIGDGKEVAEEYHPAPPKQPAGPSLVHSQSREKKRRRRNRRYEAIDTALREISEARPESHEEVFRFLGDRKVAIARREPFKSAAGWLKGFQQNPHLASAWLSQAWGRLDLPAFARGPKK